jgi:hypothetical protein
MTHASQITYLVSLGKYCTIRVSKIIQDLNHKKNLKTILRRNIYICVWFHFFQTELLVLYD